jgi:uncharacterized LabA/DUF88 family protein
MKVLIDGENIIHSITYVLRHADRIQDRSELKAFDLIGLCRGALGSEDLDLFYYTTKLQAASVLTHGQATADKSKAIISWVAGWNTMLISQGVNVVKAGRLKIRSTFPHPETGEVQHVFQEKGVDVRLAIDLVEAAEPGVTIVLFSSDSDLIPAIHAAKAKGARVKNLTSVKGFNKGLALTCGEWQIISDDSITAAFDRTAKGDRHGTVEA